MYRIVFLFILFISACKTQPKKTLSFSNSDINKVLNKMTSLMVHDITNPPLASRFFSYAFLSGYEVVAQNNTGFKSMHGVLADYPKLEKPDSVNGYSVELSALLAIMETAKKMQPSGKLFEEFERSFLDSCEKAGCDLNVIENSKRYAQSVSKKILEYAKRDGYNKLSNYSRYTPLNSEGSWYPTPPAYMAAVEPHFNKVRSFLLDSCSQFKPILPIPFSKEKSSAFYKLMLQNYNDTLSQEHREIAAFWDCNPFAVQDKGHLMYSFKKISPGAHWLGITSLVCKKAGKNFEEAMFIHTVVSIGLMDAFICCWDEKYRSNRIRPETAIRKYLDPKWEPLLQTPPFPEYLSGHSVVSSASAVILSHFFGDNFSYTDSVEVSYGLGPRNFASFKKAAQEAGISRFYGGIHFMDAVDNGLIQGENVGNWILQRLELQKDVALK